MYMSLILYNTVYTSQEYVVPDWGSCTDAELATALEKHYAGEIDLHEHWKIEDGIVRPVTLTTGEQIELVLMHPTYPLAGQKVDTPVGNLSVGSVIQLNENGLPVDYIIVHQGNPDPEMYDASCNGTWVVRKDILEIQAWDGSNNDYKNSDVHAYLNGTVLNNFDADIKEAILTVKIPYQNGTGSGGSVASGSNGLSCKLFLLSGFEVGFTKSDSSYFPVDGARLAYFTDASKRIAYLNGATGYWWLRSPNSDSTVDVFVVFSGGDWVSWRYGNSLGVRPALVLPSSLSVSDDGSVKTNQPPSAPPTCAFVVGMKDCLNTTHAMNSSNTNAGGWNKCAMRSWLNSKIYNQIPESFRQNLKLMNVWTANGGNQSGTTGVYSQNYLALPAEREVFGSNSYFADSSIESQLFQFDWYKTSGNRIKKVNGSNDWWWERSPRRSNTSGFCGVGSGGGADISDATISFGVSFFCAI